MSENPKRICRFCGGEMPTVDMHAPGIWRSEKDCELELLRSRLESNRIEAVEFRVASERDWQAQFDRLKAERDEARSRLNSVSDIVIDARLNGEIGVLDRLDAVLSGTGVKVVETPSQNTTERVTAAQLEANDELRRKYLDPIGWDGNGSPVALSVTCPVCGSHNHVRHPREGTK